MTFTGQQVFQSCFVSLSVPPTPESCKYLALLFTPGDQSGSFDPPFLVINTFGVKD